MRITEASRKGGVTVSTMKYYVVQGLVHEGQRLSQNQTAYDETHVQRVRLVRALLEAGGLSVATAKNVLSVLDAEDTTMGQAFEVAQNALSSTYSVKGQASDAARERIIDLISSRSWNTKDVNPGVDVAARVLDGYAAIGFTPSAEYLDAYASAAELISNTDMAALATRDRPELITELMVVGTVLGDALSAGLRRIAQEDASARISARNLEIGCAAPTVTEQDAEQDTEPDPEQD